MKAKEWAEARKEAYAKKMRKIQPWPVSHHEQVAALEISNIKRALAEGGDRSKAAHIMGIQRTTLVMKMKKFGLAGLTAAQCREEIKETV
jgi:sigma-54 dependent transcriptional regulator, flagellar regulatory protein